MCHPAFVLRLSRLEQSAPFGQFWGIGDCVTCYGFGGGLCYVLRLWAVVCVTCLYGFRWELCDTVFAVRHVLRVLKYLPRPVLHTVKTAKRHSEL